MDINDFENSFNDSNRGTYYSSPRWDEFTIDDEKTANKRFSRFFFSLFVYMLTSTLFALGVQFAVSFLAGERADSIFENTWFIWGLNILSMYVISLPIMYFIVRKMKNTVRFKENMTITEFLKLFVIAEALMTIGNLIGTYLNAIIGTFIGRDITNSTSELIEKSPVWLIVLVAVIIGPIVEELIFRKLLMDKLGMYGDRIAIVVSAVSFGIFHGNLYQLFYATLLGLVLAYMYSKTSNIWYPIVMHMIINFFGSIIPLPLLDKVERYEELITVIANGGQYDTNEFAQLTMIIGVYSLIQWALTIGGIVLIYKMKQKLFISDRCEIMIPKSRLAKVIILNVGTILFITFMIINMVLNIILI